MPPQPLPNDASRGLVTSRDPSSLARGELSQARACEYRLGSPHLYKQKGRSDLNASLGSSVTSICKLQYDSASDVLAAVAGGTVYESSSSTSPVFSSSGLTGLTASAIPSFSGIQDRWTMCNGVDSNYIREPAAVPGGSTGSWRPLSMQPPTVAPTYTIISSGSTAVRPTTSTGTYQNQARAYDTDSTTYSEGTSGLTSTWTWTSNFAIDACTLYIDHAATDTTGSKLPHGIVSGSFTSTTFKVLVEYSVNAGSTWTTIKNTGTMAREKTVTPISIGTTLANNLKIRATVTGNGTHDIYDLYVTVGAGASYTATNDIFYGFTELYYDSNGLEYESKLSPMAQVLASDLAAKYGVTLTFPTKANTRTAQFRIYRSIDTPGGGYPNLYVLSTIPSTSSTWSDDFSTLPSATPTTNLLTTYTVLYPDGNSLIYEPGGAAPLANLALPYLGCMVYVPASASLSHRIYYSLSSTLSPVAMEYVPDFQWLDFQSPRNDTVVSAAVTNGGKSLLVFFANYTMLVNYLPQATDGTFDNRVKEYVSNNRGCAGRLACCEFTLPTGMTLVAAVDALGVWVTNGVNQMDEWSLDLDWATNLAGVDLSTAQMIDNTAKRRLELLFTAADGTRQEYHFFYGRMKQNTEGKSVPLITGPHPMGVRCKHYTQIGTGWVGFSGDASTSGKVFLEEGSDTDAAHGYDSTGIVPWTWTTGDIYPEGLSRSHLVEELQPKFQDGNPKTYTLLCTFTRDKGFTYTKTKTYASGTQQAVYIHAYTDRHHIQFSDLTNTAASAFVGYEAITRDAGPSRDK